MLVLTRKVNEKIIIRDGTDFVAEITVAQVSPGSIKLGFKLPNANIMVWRKEIDPEKGVTGLEE